MLTGHPESHFTALFQVLRFEEGHVHISLLELHALISTLRHPVTGEDAYDGPPS